VLDITEINQMLTLQAETLCSQLLPSGVIRGHEWEVGSVDGESGKSMKVCIAGGKVGVWSDFATGESGDLIDLIGSVNALSIGESVAWAKDWLGIKEERPQFFEKRKKYSKPSRPQCKATKPDSPVVEFFKSRFISKQTLEKYKVAENGNDIIFPSLVNDELIFWKRRDKDDKKNSNVSKDSMPCLFGWQAIDPSYRWIVITEGEIDALSYAEHGVPAVSVPFGGGGGAKQRWIDFEYDRLLNYDVIYVSMDNDQAGQEALQEIMPRLGQHRVLIPDLKGHKDANEALAAGLNLMTCIEDAKSIDPEELKCASEFHNEVMSYLNQPPSAQGSVLPWEKTHTTIRIRTGEVSIWVGMNGHGKTQALGQVCVNNAYLSVRTCVASLEMKPEKLLSRQYRQASFTNSPSKEQGEKVRDLLDNNIWLFNLRGTAKAARILEVFQYAYKRYGIQQFIIDNLSKCGYNDDDYNGQKSFVDAITDFAVENDVHVHLVVHSRKRENEDSPPNKMDVKGSGAITDMADNVFSVWRNKPKEDKKNTNPAEYVDSEPDCLLGCYKQRNGEWEGKVKLWFEPRSLQFTDSAERRGYVYV